MAFVGGIDGGQSATEAAVADGYGRILGRGAGPPADLVGEPPGSARQRFALESALAAALREAGLAPKTRLSALVIGLTGHDAGTPAPFAFANASARFVHDTEIAHAGALGGEAGIVVLAGTGSVALGNTAGSGFVRAGGWGYFFGDEGSALWIARSAIAAAMQAADRGSVSPLGEEALGFFGFPNLRAVQRAFARGELSRPALAAFAARALALETQESRRLRLAAVTALAELVRAVESRLAPAQTRRVSYAGGVFSNAALAHAFGRLVRRGVPNAVVEPPRAGPVEGALALARRAAHDAAT